MLDINFIKENAEAVKRAARDKLINTNIDRLLELERQIKAQSSEIDLLRGERNALSKNNDAQNMEASIIRVKEIKEMLAEKEPRLNSLRGEFNAIMLTVPSVPMPEVPVGRDERDNVEVKRWGKPPEFDFKTKDHIELAESLELVEIPAAVKFAGSRSYFLKNEAVLLEMALCRFTLDRLISKGFTPMTVPQLVKESAMIGTGYFPAGTEQAYKITEDELYLIGTSEVALVSYHQNDVLSENELPKKYAGLSTCFRREAGTYGKDTRGLYRVHQFQKVEQVVICRNDDEESERLHNEILANTEEILQALGLAYRVVLACTGELGIGQVKKHDIETWMPSRNAYCETHSCSSFKDFQARRSNIKYRGKGGALQYVYTLNNTGIASPRILIPLLEVYQQEDGSVKIPEVLVPYMGGMKEIKRKN